MRLSRHLHVPAVLCICLCLGAAVQPATQPTGAGTPLFTGGVAGVAALAVPENSDAYRAAGGGLYLHHNGWISLDKAQQAQVVDLFRDRPVAIELGFKSGDGAQAWATALRRNYLDQGIRPQFIAANAFSSNRVPTPELWRAYTAALRQAGLAESCLVLPTFEYANFMPNRATLEQNTIRRRPDFQAIAKDAGGIVLDTPPGYFFQREQAYRDWVVDAIRSCRFEGLEVVVILSPHKSGPRFHEDTDRFLRYLLDAGAVPTAFVCENYEGKAAADYPNVVGSEDDPNTTLGLGLVLLRQYLAARP